MQELLEQLLEAIATTTSIWLTPKGEEESALPDHVTNAVTRLAKLKGEKPDSSSYAFRKFMKISGYVRVYMSSFGDELGVSVGSKVTSVQLSIIGKLAREYPSFHWDVYDPQEKEWISDKGYREFVSTLRSSNLLENKKVRK